MYSGVMARAPPSNRLCRVSGERPETNSNSMSASSGRSGRTVTIGSSEPDLAGEHVLPHHPIAHETPQRVSEGGGAVLLEEIVTDPREGIAAEQAGQQPPEVQRRERVQQEAEAERGADEMQPPAGAVGVLAEVEGIELAEALHGYMFG